MRTHTLVTLSPSTKALEATLNAPAEHDVAADERELAAELPRLMSLAYSILRDREEAAEAIQETAEQAWRSWHAIRDPGRRAAWLSTICVRQSLRRARTEPRQRLVPWRPRPETTGDAGVSDVDLERALHRLSARQRAVVGLHYVYGYPLDEIAAVLGCRPGTARSHLNRALKSLRDSLGGDSR